MEAHWKSMLDKIVEAIDEQDYKTVTIEAGNLHSTCLAAAANLIEGREKQLEFMKEMCDATYLDAKEKLETLEETAEREEGQA